MNSIIAKWTKYTLNDNLAIGTQNGCPKIHLVGSFLIFNKAGVMHNAMPITNPTLFRT